MTVVIHDPRPYGAHHPAVCLCHKAVIRCTAAKILIIEPQFRPFHDICSRRLHAFRDEDRLIQEIFQQIFLAGEQLSYQNTVMNLDQLFRINASEAIFHEELCGHAGSTYRRSGKSAIVALLHTAAGTARLQYDQIRLLAPGDLQALFCPRAELHIHVPAILCCDHALSDLRRNARRRQAPHLLRADGDHVTRGKQLQDFFIAVVTAVIFTVFTCQAGADHDLHRNYPSGCPSCLCPSPWNPLSFFSAALREFGMPRGPRTA